MVQVYVCYERNFAPNAGPLRLILNLRKSWLVSFVHIISPTVLHTVLSQDLDSILDASSRYAIESDEEEDEYNPLNPITPSGTSDVDVRVLGNVSKSEKVIVVFGEAAKCWVKGASLGEQVGAITVNGQQVRNGGVALFIRQITNESP